MGVSLIMLTFWLWHKLRNPARLHPLYKHFKLRPHDSQPFAWLRILSGGALAALVLVGLILLPFFAVLVIMGLITSPFLFVLFNGSVLGAYWAVRISSDTAGEYASGRFDLLKLTPAGGLGVAWFIALGNIYRTETLRQASFIVSVIVQGVLIILTFIAVLLIVISTSPRPSDISQAHISVQLSGAMIPLYVSMILLYFDHRQSILLGILVGMIIPLYIPNRLTSGLYSLFLFLTVQLASYALIFAAFLGLAFGLQALPLTPLVLQLVLAAIGLALVIGGRELVLRGLFYHLCQLYEATTQDQHNMGLMRPVFS